MSVVLIKHLRSLYFITATRVLVESCGRWEIMSFSVHMKLLTDEHANRATRQPPNWIHMWTMWTFVATRSSWARSCGVQSTIGSLRSHTVAHNHCLHSFTTFNFVAISIGLVYCSDCPAKSWWTHDDESAKVKMIKKMWNQLWTNRGKRTFSNFIMQQKTALCKISA